MKLSVVPARAGSKGLPDKNKRPFLGVPLLCYAVRQARASGVFDCVAFTSDSQEYLKLAEAEGADVLILRPPEFSSDTAGMLDVVRHAALEAEARTGQEAQQITLLQVTSPLRQVRHIKEAVELFANRKDATNLVSVCRSKASPYFTLCETNSGGYLSLAKQIGEAHTRRQDLPVAWQINGAIYLWSREAIFSDKPTIQDRTIGYEMDNVHSLDIDTEDDFLIAELVGKHIVKLDANA